MSIGYFWDDDYKNVEEELSKQLDCPRCKHRNNRTFICDYCVRGSKFTATDDVISNKFRELCDKVKKKYGKE